MQCIATFVALALPALAVAQGYGGGGKSSTVSKATAAATTPAATTSASSAVHTVDVGQGGLVFVPNNIKASVGDQVEFHWSSAGHSVAEGSQSNPCQPLGATAFYSGFPGTGGQPFTITINSTDPIYYYCSAPDHCQAGMVGGINVPEADLKNYAAAASKTSSSGAPANVQGGVFAVASSGSGSGSSASSTTTSATAPVSTGAASRTWMSSFGIAVPIALIGFKLL